MAVPIHDTKTKQPRTNGATEPSVPEAGPWGRESDSGTSSLAGIPSQLATGALIPESQAYSLLRYPQTATDPSHRS